MTPEIGVRLSCSFYGESATPELLSETNDGDSRYQQWSFEMFNQTTKRFEIPTIYGVRAVHLREASLLLYFGLLCKEEAKVVPPQKLLIVMQRLDDKIGLMLESYGEHFNKRWGFFSRAGLWDKSHLMRQIEKYADIYTSRVSNFLNYTPFMYFRSQEQSLAHDSPLPDTTMEN